MARITQTYDFHIKKEDGTAQRITQHKREIKDFPKLPSATSFIRKPLYAIDSLLETN